MARWVRPRPRDRPAARLHRIVGFHRRHDVEVVEDRVAQRPKRAVVHERRLHGDVPEW